MSGLGKMVQLYPNLSINLIIINDWIKFDIVMEVK